MVFRLTSVTCFNGFGHYVTARPSIQLVDMAVEAILDHANTQCLLLVEIEITADIGPIIMPNRCLTCVNIGYTPVGPAMKMDVPATVITDMIVTDLNAIVAAVGTTSLHENVIAIAADPAAVQRTRMGHSVRI